jgi:Tfp pilus assembly protein PilF
LAAAHNNLGNLLRDLKRPAEAEKALRRALALEPDFVEARYNLGLVLADLMRPAEAEKAFRRVIDLRPDFALAHYSLGLTLLEQKRYAEAEKACRRAIQLRPDFPDAYNTLGNALYLQKKLPEAEKAYRKAIQLRPDLVQAHANLGSALLDQKKLEEAAQAFRKADQLLPGHPLIRANLRQTEYLLRLDRKLTACLAGKARPDSPQECLLLANHCGYFRERPRAALRMSLEAFQQAPKLAEGPQAGFRYNAACFAALVAAGKGKDAGTPTNEERALWRRQALTWLRADLAAWARLIEKGPPQALPAAQRVLADWQRDADLATIRDPAALAELPAEERAACERLWADAAGVLRKASKGG